MNKRAEEGRNKNERNIIGLFIFRFSIVHHPILVFFFFSRGIEHRRLMVFRYCFAKQFLRHAISKELK